MLMSMTCAPFSTCWRATASASSNWPFEDHAREGLRAGDVGALADVDEQRVVADDDRLEAGQAHAPAAIAGTVARRERRSTRLGDRLDVLRRGAAAAAGDVEEAALRELLSRPR